MWLKLWLNFCDSSFVTKVLLLKLCYLNFVTNFVRLSDSSSDTTNSVGSNSDSSNSDGSKWQQ